MDREGRDTRLLLATAAIVPGVFWLTRGIHERGRVAARVACVLAVMGALGHAALAAFYLVVEQTPKGGADARQMMDLLDRATTRLPSAQRSCPS